MWTGVQFTGSLAANQTGRWFTFGWNPASHVVWYVVPTSPQPGAAQVNWDVAVERGNDTQCSYWITVTNLTSNPVTFEGRYAVLA
jgi:glycyl-tRNA synthetase alpha subunit